MPENQLPDSLIGRLFHHAQATPDHAAVVTPKVVWSYAHLAQRVALQAAQLAQAGVTAESVVGISCAGDVEALLLNLAVVYLGATSCTLPTHETASVSSALAERCGVTQIVDADWVQADVGSAMADLSSGSAPFARLLFSTSGTTGLAKLVVLHDTDIVAQAHRHIQEPSERFLCLASMEHNFARRHRLYCVAAGATNVFIAPEPAGLVAACRALAVNVLHVSAFQAQELLAVPAIEQLGDIRLKLGGSHASALLRQQLRNRITPRLQAGYGTTETGAIGFTDPDDPHANEHVGQPLPGLEVRILSPQGEPLGPQTPGEVVVGGGGLFREYLGMPEQTAARLKQGWFYTGDIGYLDEQRHLYLCGRRDDMFVFNSINIFPQEIEAQIRQFADIDDAAVIPKPSVLHGQIPIALVVFKPQTDPNLLALKRFVHQRVGVRCPRQFQLVAEIPRNAAGKIIRAEAIGLSTSRVVTRSDIVQALPSATRNKLNLRVLAAFEQGDKDISLRDLRMDSLARMEFLVALELAFDVVIYPAELSKLPALSGVVELIQSSPTAASDTDTLLPEAAMVYPWPAEEDTPFEVRFFRRVVRICHTVAQLSRALITLEHRLLPQQVQSLSAWQGRRQLLPATTEGKFLSAVTLWLQLVQERMAASGKQIPEPYTATRVAPTVTHYCGPGAAADKVLVICFAFRGGRQMMMPNAVLLQHMDASRYDLLVVAEPLKADYRLGVPPVGKNLTEVCNWLAQLELIGDYPQLRTFGCSAGGYAALIAGYRLGAEVIVGIGTRFYSKRYPHRIAQRMYSIWRCARSGHRPEVVLCYSTASGRDRKYARFVARTTAGRLFGVECTEQRIGHGVLRRLADRGELVPFFEHTLFAPTMFAPTLVGRADSPAEARHWVLRVPELVLKPLK